jgi:hypothetical protein
MRKNVNYILRGDKNQRARIWRNFLLPGLLCFVFFGFTTQSNQLQCQNIVAVEYFVNSDPGLGSGIPLSISPAPDIQNLNFELDISTLDNGFNHLYVRAKAGNGKWSLTNVKSFFKEPGYALPQNIVKAEYFINADPGFGNATDIPLTASANITGLNFGFDINDLPNGFHNLYVRVKDENGQWSLTNVKSFLKTNAYGELQNIVKAEYFFNADPGLGNAVDVPLTPSPHISDLSFSVDISELPIGFHYLYLRMVDENGLWSLTNVKSFFKEPGYALPQNIVKAEYFINTDPGFGNATDIPVTASANITGLNFGFDINDLPNGFHNLYVRVKDENGQWSLTNVKSFLKTNAYGELQNIVKAEYFFNTDPGLGNAVDVPLTPSPHISDLSFSIDVSDLELGFHQLYLRTKDENGLWSLTNVKTFFKEKLYADPQNIVKAEYFYNEDPGFGNGIDISLTAAPNLEELIFYADNSYLPIGLHQFFVRTQDQNGNWSLTNNQMFLIQCADVSVDFEPSPGCATMPVDFMDMSTNVYPLAQYIWDFGDGTPEVTAGVGDMVHIFDQVGEYTVKLTIISRPECIDYTTKTIIINHPPTVYAGEDQTICYGDDVTLNATYTYGTLTWSHGVVNGQPFTPAQTTTYTATSTSIYGCGPVTDQVTITVIQHPVSNAGADATICEDQTLHLSDVSALHYSSVLWSGNVSNPAIVHPVYTPTPSDIASGFAELCILLQPINPCTVSDSDCMMVTIVKNPVVYAGQDVTICEDESYSLNLATAANYSALLWSGNVNNSQILNPVYTPTAADIANGFAVLCLTAQPLNPCTVSAQDCLTITIQKNPVASPGIDATICDTETFETAAAYATDYSAVLWQTTNGFGDFLNGDELLATYQPHPDDPPVVELCLEAWPVSPCAIYSIGCMELTIAPSPAIEILSPPAGSIVCMEAPIELTTAASNCSDYVWTTSGNGSFTGMAQGNVIYIPGTTDLAAGMVNLCVEGLPLSGCSESATDCITFNVQPPPQITLMPEMVLDCADYDFELDEWLPVQITAEVQHAGAVQWQTSGDGIFSDPLSPTTLYTISLDDFINGAVELTLSATGEDLCMVEVSESITLQIPGQMIRISATGARGISSYVDQSMLTVPQVVAPLTGSLMFMQNAQGQVYNPGSGVNQIGNWSATGYLANFGTAPACLPVYGAHLTDRTFNVTGPVTYIPVLTDYPVAIEDLFEGHLEKIQMIFDWSTFASWTPDAQDLQELKPGFAYSLTTVDEDADFTIEFPPYSWMESPTHVAINGVVLNQENGNPVAGVEIASTGQPSVYTNAAGEYVAIVPHGWSGTITPVREHWEFSPVTKSYTNVVVNIYDQHFTGVNTECDPGWECTVTLQTHTIAIPLSVNPAIFGEPLDEGDYIGVFYLDDVGEEACGGFVQWNGTSAIQLTAYGDDPITPEKDGFLQGEPILWKLYSCSGMFSCDAQATYHQAFPQSSGTFSVFGFSSLLSLGCDYSQEIVLNENWNDISLFVQPDNMSAETILQPIVNDLIIMRNLSAMYWPAETINTIGDWDLTSGYVVKMQNPNTLSVPGSPLTMNQISLSLTDGSWHYLPVISPCGGNVADIFSAIQDDVVMIKEIIGTKVWWPQFGIATLDELVPSRAYAIKIADDVVVEFPDCTGKNAPTPFIISNKLQTHWGEISLSPFNHLIYIPDEIAMQFGETDELGVFNSDGMICGVYHFSGSISGGVLVVKGDDGTSAEIDGMMQGEPFSFKIYDSKSGETREIQAAFDEKMPDQQLFALNGMSGLKHIDVTGTADIAGGGVDLSVYPNPSGDIFHVQLFNVQDKISWQVMNLQGAAIQSGEAQGKFEIDLSGRSKGIYYLKLTTGGLQTVRKLVLQ